MFMIDKTWYSRQELMWNSSKPEFDFETPVVQRDFEPKIAANDEKGSQSATFETLDETFRPKDPEKQGFQSRTQVSKTPSSYQRVGEWKEPEDLP